VSPQQRDLFVRLGAAVVATLVLAPVAGALLDKVPFHRVMTRIFLATLVIAFVVKRGHPRTWPDRLRAMGLAGPDRAPRFLAGLVSAILLTALLLALSWALGARTGAAPFGEPPPLGLHLLKAAAAALVVSFLEEILCRGYFLDVLGGGGSALIYAAAHYIRPLHGSAPADGFDPLLGVKRVHELLGSFHDARNLTLGIFSLFLFGLALNRLRERTGTLYVGIGLHAGLVFVLALYPRFLTSYPGAEAAWIHGGGRLHDGVLGTLMLGLLLLAAYRLPLPGFCTRRNT
jgi:membrane protease YdiL (CAAX protease family)